MGDGKSVHVCAYVKSEDLEDIKLWRRIIILAQALPILIVKLLIIAIALIFELLKQLLFCIIPRPLKDIRGHIAVVTGGGNGIGREICLELARCGCSIACLDIDLDSAKHLCDEIEQLGVKANAYKVDVSDPKEIEEVKTKINTDLGIVNILVNNAGLMPLNSFRIGDIKSIRRVMDVNVLAHFWTTSAFIHDMIEQHSGYIVGIASMVAFYPISTSVSYTTSKFAVKGFMDTLTRESLHENWGIKTLTVFPHMTNTCKEVTDYWRKKIPPSILEQVGFQNPIDIAKRTVHALRTDAGYVTMPDCFLLAGKIYQLLPFNIQHFADKLIMPRITSGINYNVANNHKQ